MLCRVVLLLFVTLLNAELLRPQRPTSPRNAAIDGQILGENDAPVGAQIMGYHLGVRVGQFVPVLECATSASPDGSFHCPHFEPGPYVLVATSLRSASAGTQQQVSQSSPAGLPLFTYYPAISDPDLESLPRLASSETQSVLIRVNEAPVADLRVTSAVAPMKGKVLELSLQGQDFSIPVSVRVNADPRTGNYHVAGIPATSYALVEDWAIDGISHQATGSISASVGTSNNTSLSELKQFSFTGTVRFSDPQSSSETSELFLKSNVNGTSRRYVAAIRNGSFTFKDIRGGSYQLAFNPGDQFYASDIESNGQPVSDARINVNENISRAVLTVVATPAYATLSGQLKLQGGEPHPALLLQSLASHLDQIVPVDRQGLFKITGLAPGKYRVFGWADATAIPYESSGFLRRYSDKALDLTVEGSANLTNIEVECNAPSP